MGTGRKALLLACVALLGVALVAVALAGCGSTTAQTTATTASSAATDSSATTAASTATTVAGKAYKIVYVSWSQSSVKDAEQLAAMQAVAKKNGWTITVMDAQGDPSKMVPLIQDAVQTSPDVVITEVFPASQITAAAQAAKAKGIPIISLGGGLGDGVEAYWDDGVPFGEAVAQTVLTKVGTKGDVLLLGYSPGAPATGRENGFKNALKAANATYTIDRQEIPVPGEVEAGLKFAQAWLTSHPKGGGPYVIFGTWDEPAVGAVSALRQMGRTDVYVYGVDGSPQGFQAIKDGTMTGTLWSDPQAVGTAAAEAIPQIIANGVSGDKTMHVMETYTMVTKDNVDQIIKDHPYVMGSQQ
jgi:ABC-type sugar transport system substrate-binding protein